MLIVQLIADQTAISLGSVKQEMADAIVMLPAQMRQTLVEKELYAYDGRLQEAFSIFYVAVVDAILELAEMMLKSKFGKLWRAVLQQDSYGDNLRKALQAVEVCTKFFQAQSSSCSKQELRDTRQAVRLIGESQDKGKLTGLWTSARLIHFRL